jgi:hypothetical protein
MLFKIPAQSSSKKSGELEMILDYMMVIIAAVI